MGFYWSLSDRKSPQVSMTILNILADLNNTVVRMVPTRSLISKSSNPCINRLVTVSSAPVSIDITVTLMFHSFFQFSSKVYVLISLFAFLQFYPVDSPNGKVHYSAGSLSFFPFFFFFFVVTITITRPGRLAEIKWSVSISKSQRS